MKPTICVDLDGTLAEHDGWKGVDHFGKPLPGAVEFTRALSEFADVVIFTARCNAEMRKPERPHLYVGRVKEWLDKHGFVYSHIYAEGGKPIASAYVDDRAVVCTPQVIDPVTEPGFSYRVALAACKSLVEERI